MRALKSGVRRIINVGFDTEGNFQALALAKKYDFIWSTMGIHPHLASEWNDYVAQKILKAVKAEPRIVALGEMGLDFFKNYQPPDLQMSVFRAQLAMARELDMPVIVHCRDAFEDCLRILDEENIEQAIFHCYTGDLAMAEDIWSRGYATSFTGIVTYPSAKELQLVAVQAPLDLIFVETDCPYLAPQSVRGKRNEPAYMAETAAFIAGLKNMPVADLEHEIEHNVYDWFGI